MEKIFERIKNFVLLHSTDLEDGDYVRLMRRIAGWATNQADLTEGFTNYDIENPDNNEQPIKQK